MKIPNTSSGVMVLMVSLARIVSEDSQLMSGCGLVINKSSKDS